MALQHENTCFECGYDLRATDPASVCPECGTSVAASITAWKNKITHRKRTWCALVCFALVYIVINFSYIISKFIPSDHDLYAWGFIIPPIVALAGWIISFIGFRDHVSRVVGIVFISAVCFIVGSFNVWFITACWAAV